MRVEIPKKLLDEIMARFACSQEEASKALLEAQQRASETYETTLHELLSKAGEDTTSIPTFTPIEIKGYLDKYVIGQEAYKRRLCIAASYHFGMIKFFQTHPEARTIKRFRKKNTLIAGPTGSGKTYCAEVLGDLLRVPTLIIDSTDYTEAGYVGKSADDMIRELIDMAPGNNRLEQIRFVSQNGGIIFIDEIDKKAKDGSVLGHDISREGFQRSVLKLMERKLVPVDNPFSPASQIQDLIARQSGKKDTQKDKMISTENILFILGGSFQRNVDDLESIVKKRIEHKGNLKEDGSIVVRGLGAGEPIADKDTYRNLYAKAEARDYIRFGLLPEMVGRAPIRTYVKHLSKNDLVRIMKETEDSILEQYRLEFKIFNIDLEFADSAIDFVAKRAEASKTGARALVSVWEGILSDFQFELPGKNFTHIRIDKEICRRPKEALLALLEKSPFVDFIEGFKQETGITLELAGEAEEFIRKEAKRKDQDLAVTVKELLAPASALNYMNLKGSYEITVEMLKDPKYFDHMFTQWHDLRMKES